MSKMSTDPANARNRLIKDRFPHNFISCYKQKDTYFEFNS